MTYDASSQSDMQHYYFRQQRDAAGKRDPHQETAPKIEMIVGPWRLDELGNRTREIRARE